MRRCLDLAVAFVILGLSLGIYLYFFNVPTGSNADIYVRGELYKSVSLEIDGDYELDGGGYHIVLRVAGGRIRFLESGCPDKVCVETGWLSGGGRVAACAPAGVVVRVAGSGDNEVDAVLQ